MTRATMNLVNMEIASKGIELAKGKDYFFFAAIDGAPADVNIPASVYVSKIRDLTLEEWVELTAMEVEAPKPKKVSTYIRGNSTTMTPCARVHFIADRMLAEDPSSATRKAVMAACMEAGVTYGTARTQYQKWKSA